MAKILNGLLKNLMPDAYETNKQMYMENQIGFVK